MRPVLGLASAAAGLLVFAGQNVLAQSLTSVPDNAIIMVKVNNLDQTSKKLGDLFQQWGLAAFSPTLSDPLVALEGKANLQQGLNRAGEGAFILVNPMSVPGGQGAPPVIIMLPVTDYDAFIKNFPDAQADGELTMVTLPISDEIGYIAKWGNFAAISPNRSIIAEKPKATKVAGLAAKELQDRDIVAYVNFPGFRNQAASGLTMGRGAAIGQISQVMQQNPDKAKLVPVASAAMNQLFNGLDHVVNETQAMTLGVDLSKTGLQFGYMADFVPESYLAKMVAGWKTPQTKMISGLPDSKYVFAGGAALDTNTLSQLVDDMAGPIRAAAVTMGEPGKPFVGYIDAIKQVMTATTGQSFGFSVGEGEVGKTPLFDTVVVSRGDADKLTAAQKDVVQYEEQFTQLFQMPGQPKTSNKFTPAAKSVGGVEFNQVTMAMEGGQPNNPGQKMMEMLYGQGGFSMLMGKLDANTLLGVSYKQDAQIQAAITAAKAGTDPLASDAQVKEVSTKLPQNSFFTMYVFPEQLMRLASRVSQTVSGNPLQTQLPPNVQPIAISGSTDATAVRFSVYVPSSVVQAGVSAGLQQAMRQNQQQRPPRANPRPQPQPAPSAPAAQ